MFALRELAPWRRCAASATLGADVRGQLGAGVLLAAPRSAFLQRWRASFRQYDPATWEHGACNSTTALAAGAPPGDLHAAAELGPLPRYKPWLGLGLGSGLETLILTLTLSPNPNPNPEP